MGANTNASMAAPGGNGAAVRSDATESIRAEGLSYAIGDTQILRSVSLAVEQGQMVGIIGPNGSGKTTFLRHVYRALPSDRRTVFINGRDLYEYSYGESARTVTVVRQEMGSDFDFTVQNMVLLGRAPYHRSFEGFSDQDRAIADEALASIGMQAYRDRSFNGLSGGEKQRVLIARSLAQRAQIMLLDEPTNHLDVHYQWSLMQLIRGLQVTVLGVFHELNLAAHFCDQLYVLARGQVVAHGTPAQVLTSELMGEVFGVDAEIVLLPRGQPHVLIHGASKPKA